MSCSVQKWGLPGGQGSTRFLWVPQVPRSLLRDRLCNQLSHSEKNCIVYRLFCVFFFYDYYYYSFPYCLLKLSLSQPMSFAFCPFSSPSHCGGEKWASGCLVLVAGCQVKPRHKLTFQTKVNEQKKYWPEMG